MTGSIADILSPTIAENDDAAWFVPPQGYVPLPTDNIERVMSDAKSYLTELISDGGREKLTAVADVLTALLGELTTRNVVYCAIGRHLSPIDGTAITSSLTVGYQRFSDEERNPKLILKDMVEVKSSAGERGQTDLVEIDNRPMLFFESTRELPTPQFPGQPTVVEGSMTKVFQLQAMVPSVDGTRMATIDFSTPIDEHGAEFRAMVVLMAASVSFEPPSGTADTGFTSASIERALG